MPQSINNQSFLRTSAVSLLPKKLKRIDNSTILFLILFLLAFLFVPEDNHSISNPKLQLWFSIIIFSSTLLLLWTQTRLMLPSFFGTATILYALRNFGVIFGAGVDIYYFIGFLIIMVRLPNKRTLKQIQLKGFFPIILLFIVYLTSMYWSFINYSEINYLEIIRSATFILITYFLYKKIDVILFNAILTCVLLGNTLLLGFIIFRCSFYDILTTRLGESIGINPNTTGAYALISLICLLFIIILRKSKVGIFHCIFILFLIAIIFLTGSRSTMVMIFVLASLVFIKRKVLLSRNKLAVIVLGLVLFLCTAPFVIGEHSLFSLRSSIEGSHQYDRMGNLLIDDRASLDELSWSLARQHPLFGVGIGNYTKYSARANIVNVDKTTGQYHHNAIAGTAAECGYVGLFLFLLWYWRLLSSSAPGGKWCEYIIALALCGMISGVTHGIFLNFQGSLWFFLGISMQYIEEQK